MHILLIEGDAAIRCSTARLLRREGIRLDECGNIADIAPLPRSGAYDAVILDVAAPYERFITFPEKLRSYGNHTPVLVLASRDVCDRYAAELALETDVLVRPFKFAELLARLRAIVSKHASSAENILRCGNIGVNTSARGVYVNGAAIQLLAREYGVLLTLMRNVGKVLTVTQLEGETGPCGTGDIDACIRSLRRKLGAAGDSIVTVRGRGYTLDAQRRR